MVSERAGFRGRIIHPFLPEEVFKLQRRRNLTECTEIIVTGEELKDKELFVFTENLVSGRVFQKGTLKMVLLFDIVLRLHQVQKKGDLILKIIHISGTRMIEAGIDGLSIGNNM